MGSICLLPRLEGVGGPASFHAKFARALRQRGQLVHNNPYDPDCTAILVIGGTRHLNWLWQARRRGVRVVQRLDGMNWIHRKRSTGLRHYLRSEINNMILATIRRRLSDAIIYQSQFVQERWRWIYGPDPVDTVMIYNGVDLSSYSPDGSHERPQQVLRVLVVEGRLKGGHEVALENSIYFAEKLDEIRPEPVELMIVADVSPAVKKFWNEHAKVRIIWKDVIERDEIPFVDRSAHVLFSAEVNAPCPNSVIEALACGLPVLSFATGSLPELVQGDAGRLVPYGENYENLGKPDVSSLAVAANEVIDDQERFRKGARQRAVDVFDIEAMVDRYLEVLT